MDKFLVNNSDLNEHLQLIHEIAWKMHAKSGHDPEDLFSEGCLQYLLKKEKFIDSKGTKATTFIWKVVWNALINYIKMQTKVPFTHSTDILNNMSDYPIEVPHTKQINRFYLDKFQYAAY